jgi:hypothetical protein
VGVPGDDHVPARRVGSGGQRQADGVIDVAGPLHRDPRPSRAPRVGDIPLGAFQQPERERLILDAGQQRDVASEQLTEARAALVAGRREMRKPAGERGFDRLRKLRRRRGAAVFVDCLLVQHHGGNGTLAPGMRERRLHYDSPVS